MIANVNFFLLPNNTNQLRFRVQEIIKVAANNISHCTLMIDTPGCENLWLQFDTNKSNTFVIGVVYRHPNSNYEDFRDKLDLTIAKLSATSSKYRVTQKDAYPYFVR